VAAGVALAGIAQSATVVTGDLVITAGGSYAPSQLPAHRPAPITLQLSGAFRTVDGSHLPAAKRFTFDFDRHGQLHTEGLPTCSAAQLMATTLSQARKVCGDALVGIGHSSAEIAFPEQKPFTAAGQMLMFHGASKPGETVVLLQFIAKVPVPTTFVVRTVTTKRSGVYGMHTIVTLPPIAGGAGSVKSFHVSIHRIWNYRGRRHSFLTGECPTGRLFAHVMFDFVGGTRFTGTAIKHCTARP
jgi:hypothetical protein